MRTSWKRAMSERVVLCLFLRALRGGNEGEIGLRHLAFMYGISCDGDPSYVRQVDRV